MAAALRRLGVDREDRRRRGGPERHRRGRAPRRWSAGRRAARRTPDARLLTRPARRRDRISRCPTTRQPAQPRPSTPQWTPSARELDDLDLLVNDCFSPPLRGFVDPAQAGPGGAVTLVVAAATADQATRSGRSRADRPRGRAAGSPAGRRHLAGPDGAGSGLVGPVERLAHNAFGPFRRLHIPPAALHETARPTRCSRSPYDGP